MEFLALGRRLSPGALGYRMPTSRATFPAVPRESQRAFSFPKGYTVRFRRIPSFSIDRKFRSKTILKGAKLACAKMVVEHDGSRRNLQVSNYMYGKGYSLPLGTAGKLVREAEIR